MTGLAFAQENPDPSLQGVTRSQIQANGLPSGLITSARGVNQVGAPQIPRSGFDIINNGTVGTVLLRGVRIFPNPADCNSLQDDAFFLITVAGRPGDADGDGAFSRNTGLCAARRNNLPPPSPKINDGVNAGGVIDVGLLTFGENVRIRLDRNCDTKADIVFSLSNDPAAPATLRVESDDLTGHGGQVLGGEGTAWEAAVFPENFYPGAPCPDPASITGHYIIRIPNFSSFFTAAGLNPTDFGFTITAGSDDDGLEEDLIQGEVHKPEPRLSITKTPDLALCPGEEGNWTIHVSNDGNVKLSNLVVTDLLPAGVTFVNVVSGGVTASGTSTLTFSAFDLAQCETKDIVFRVRANDNCSGNGVNSASVSGVFQSLCDLTNPGQLSQTPISAGPATANFTCKVKPCVTITLDTLAPQCPDTPVTVTGKAVNCGNGPERIFVRLGNGAETDLGIVQVGDANGVTFQLSAGNLNCKLGQATYTVNARATADCPPEGTDSKQVTIQCLTAPCVTLSLDTLSPQCPGTPVTVTGKVTNCGTVAARLFVQLGNATEVDLGVVQPGAANAASFQLQAGNLTCEGGGQTFTVNARAAGDCPPDAHDTKDVRVACLTLPCVSLTLDPLAAQCPGTPVTVSGKVTNCGSAPEHVFVSLSGANLSDPGVIRADRARQGTAELDLGIVQPGAANAVTFQLPAGNLLCVDGGHTYSVHARGVGDCPPEATDDKQVSIVCLTAPCVSITLDALAPQCPGTPVTVSGKAVNCGTAPGHLFVRLGNGAETDLGIVQPGEANGVAFQLPAGNLECVNGGASYTVNARATGDCPPEATDSETVNITCLTSPCVTLSLDTLPAQCPGTPVTVTGKVTNCGTAAARLFVQLGNGNEVDLGVVQPGADNAASFQLQAGNLDCKTGGATYTVNARAAGDCPPDAHDTKEVRVGCLTPPCVTLTLDALPAQCPGSPVTVTGKVVNCGSVAEHVFVNLVGGNEVDLGTVQPGAANGVTFQLPAGALECVDGGHTYSVHARAVGDCPPEATDDKQVSIVCLTGPCVSLSLDKLPAQCPGSQVTVTGKATNCGTAAGHFFVKLGDGAEVDLGIVQPGAANAVSFQLPAGALVCEGGSATYTVNARAAGDCPPDAQDSKQVTIACLTPPCVTLTLDALPAQCPGSQVTVSGKVVNCGSAAEHVFVSLAGGNEVDLGTVQPGAGNGVTFQLPAGALECVDGGHTYSVHARAVGDCPPEATDDKQVSIVCLTGPCVSLSLDKLPAQCPGSAVTVTGKATNCGTAAAHLFVQLGNGAEVDLGVVQPGAANAASFQLNAGNLVCENGSATYTVNARAAGDCPPDAHDTKQVTIACLTPPCVTLTLDVLPARCEGSDVAVTGKVVNCGSAAEHVFVKLGDGAEVDLGTVQPGQANGVTFSLPAGALVCVNGGASYVVTARAVGECEPAATDTKTATVACNTPQIEVHKTAEAEVQPGEPIHYEITVSNPSRTVDLTDVVVVDELCTYVKDPKNFGGTCDVGAPQVNGTTITWPAFNLAAGGSCKLTFEVTAVGDATPCTHDVTCTNNVRVTGHCGSATAEANASADTEIPCQPGLCRLTGGGCLNEQGGHAGHKQSTFGGNASPAHEGGGPTGNEWEHVYRDGKTILFNWHSHDAHVIECSVVPPGPCSPKAVNTRADFVGTGQYSIGAGGRDQDGNMVAYIIDHKEGSCNKNTRDIYSIVVRTGLVIGQGDIVFSTSGEIDCGNLQIHETPARLFGSGVQTPELQANVGDDVALLNRVVPNPFASSMSFAYQVPDDNTTVEIGVYNVAGRLVKTLATGTQTAGRQMVTWNGTDGAGVRMAPGVYFLKALVGGKVDTHRVIYMAQ